MKKTTWGLGLAAAGMVLFSADARAASGASDTDAKMGTSTPGGTASSDEASGHFNSLQGRVESFDRSNNTLTLSGAPQTLKIDSSTDVTKGGSRASIDDIKEGDQVRASFSGASGDTLNVKKLDILSAGASGSAATPPTTGTGSTGSGSMAGSSDSSPNLNSNSGTGTSGSAGMTGSSASPSSSDTSTESSSTSSKTTKKHSKSNKHGTTTGDTSTPEQSR